MTRRRARSLTAAVTLTALLALAAVAPGRATAQDSDCFLFGDDIVVEPGEVRDCDVIVVQGEVVVMEGGAVTGSVSVVGGDVEIAGAVDGDVWASGDALLQPSADVTGDVVAAGEVELLPGAQVGGRIGRVLGPREAVEDTVGSDVGDTSLSAEETVALGIGSVLLIVILAALFALLATTLAPKAVGNVRGALEVSMARSFFLGMVALVASPFLLLIMVPVFLLIPLLVLAYLLLLAIGSVGLSELLGCRIVAGARRPVQAALGAALLALVVASGYAVAANMDHGWVLSFFVILLQLVLMSFAVGSAMLTVFGTRPWPRPADPDAGLVMPLPGADGVDWSELDLDQGRASEMAPEADRASEGEEVSAPDANAVIGPDTDAGAPEGDQLGAPEEDRPGAPAGGAALVGDVADGPDAATAPLPLPHSPATVADEQGGEADEQGGEADEPTPGWGRAPSIRPVEGKGAGGDEAHSNPGAAPETGEPSPQPEPNPSLGLGDVPGISPVYAQLLRAGGILDLEALAAAEPSAVAAIVSVPGVTSVDAVVAELWVRHARELLG